MENDAQLYGSPPCYDEKEVREIVDDVTRTASERGYDDGYKKGVEMAQNAIKREFKMMQDGGLFNAKT